MARNIRPTWKTPYYRFDDGYTPLMVADFDVPPQSTTGNKTRRPLWESVGRAIARWSMVETELYTLFYILIQSETQSSWRALGKLISLRSQLDVIEGAAEQCFQPNRKNRNLKAIREKFKIVRAASARRNELAHGQINGFEGRGSFWVPSMFDSRKTTLGELPPDSMKYCYTSKNIGILSSKFVLLHKELFNLNTDTRKAIERTWPRTRL